VGKPGAIQFSGGSDIVPSVGTTGTWSRQDLLDVEASHRQTESDEEATSLYVLFVDGHYELDTEINQRLAAAYSATSIVIYSDTLASVCEAAMVTESDEQVKNALCTAMEVAALLHEFGHLLGLVNVGTEMAEDHQDPESVGHCDNARCIMHWSNNTASVKDLVRDYLENGLGDLPIFDDGCLADLSAFQASE
jgi:hypothetical protein